MIEWLAASASAFLFAIAGFFGFKPKHPPIKGPDPWHDRMPETNPYMREVLSRDNAWSRDVAWSQDDEYELRRWIQRNS